MANTKISALTPNTNPTGNEEFVYAYNNANGKITLDTMKSFVGGAGITTLNADANIWELSEGFYSTSHDLYYKTGEAIPVYYEAGGTFNQLLFVTSGGEGKNGYFVFSEGYVNSNAVGSYASYGYSVSSTKGVNYVLGDRNYSINRRSTIDNTGSPLGLNLAVTQRILSAQGSGTLEIPSGKTVYSGVTYTVYVESVSSSYSISAGTGISNPFNITLPSSSNKKCLITIYMDSDTTGIITGCTIES